MAWGRRNHLRALQELALGLSAEGRVEEALATLDEAAAQVRAARRAPLGSLADVLHLRAVVLGDAGRWGDAEATAREAIGVRRGAESLDQDQTMRLADSLELLANVLTRARRLDEAASSSDEVTALRATMPWAEQSRALLNRSATLLEAGREEEGLRAALALVRGALARRGESLTSDPSFVQGLSNLGVLLRQNGRWAEALAVQELAVSELRDLAATGAGRDVANLASALANQALMHLETGDLEQALPPGEEALALREDLAAAAPEAFGPELSDSLNNHAVLLHRLERHAEAAALARRCVDLRRRLHAAQPHAYERKLANALTTRAEMLVACADPEDAVAVAREGVQRFRELEAREPGGHTLWLAGGLDTLAAALALAGDDAEALACSVEAVSGARSSYAAHGAGVGGTLAEILVAGAERHAADSPDHARAWAAEAVTLLADLSVAQPDAHAEALARAEALRADLGA